MFFTSAAFASSTDTNLTTEKAQIVLTETTQSIESSDAVARDVIIIIIVTDEEIIIIVIH